MKELSGVWATGPRWRVREHVAAQSKKREDGFLGKRESFVRQREGKDGKNDTADVWIRLV